VLHLCDGGGALATHVSREWQMKTQLCMAEKWVAPVIAEYFHEDVSILAILMLIVHHACMQIDVTMMDAHCQSVRTQDVL
jgi:hypothetical protein